MVVRDGRVARYVTHEIQLSTARIYEGSHSIFPISLVFFFSSHDRELGCVLNGLAICTMFETLHIDRRLLESWDLFILSLKIQ
jgi:hypothetical protein